MEAWPFLMLSAVGVAIGLASIAVGRRRRPRPMPIAPQDAEELDLLGRLLLAEHHVEARAKVAAALERLAGRGVPLTRVTADSGVRGQAVLEFSDGTLIIARGDRLGDLGNVAIAALDQRVMVQHWSDDGMRLSLRLAWRTGSRTVQAVALATGVSG